MYHRVKGNTFKVIVETEEQVEISFTRKWNHSLEGKIVPLDIDLRYVFSFVILFYFGKWIDEQSRTFAHYILNHAKYVFPCSI